ncbi:saccharopine dehydrogenase, partial [Martensiomyces pterosporus]
RKYDVVVWGATGFTGERLVEYLALSANAGTRVALGGRSQTKLEDVRSRLAAKHPNAANSIGDMDILVGNSTDASKLRQIAALTKVVASTVGPYNLHGSQLVRACVEEKTDYCDITGEVPWVKQMHRELNDQAVSSNVHIASMCGFDCIPADLGCLMLANYAREELHEPLVHVKGSIVGIKGGVSGGTLASAVDVMGVEVRSFWDRLWPSPSPRPSETDKTRYTAGFRVKKHGIIHYDYILGSWQTFWVMSMINSEVVRWAGKVLGYGPNFSYSESMSAHNIFHATAVAIGLVYGALLMFFSFTRSILLLLKIVPSPGEGPSEAFIKTGFFSLHMEGFTDTGATVYGKVSGSTDPGYGETIKYLGESALCLAFDRSADFKPGIYPPSVIMGQALLARLR